ncbi:hypothetical protein GCM10010172_06790 [Paractinoplanes ferrugineus]|uniref:Uncharacterized protein n=1 Tax=Paractinoplanes ferrugineus TaxID=113564 RepID=A0A919MHX9_9ACTN|nr:hypothetical protein [Actinoplanes ferrugineus]GIE16293.1 hypothetical protein Afe05nite_81330 [Actinoplanes ferrugineus]
MADVVMADFPEYPPRPAVDRPLHAVAAEPVLDTHAVQAAAEGVVLDDANSAEFLGRRFRLAEKIGLMPMLAFANASKKGLDSDDMEGLAAMYALIRDVVDQTRPPKLDPDTGRQVVDPATGEPVWDGLSQWQQFEQHAIDQQADGEDLMGFVGDAMAVVAARPRKRREISSDGSPRTSQRSRGASSSPESAPDGWVNVADLGH